MNKELHRLETINVQKQQALIDHIYIISFATFMQRLLNIYKNKLYRPAR